MKTRVSKPFSVAKTYLKKIAADPDLDLAYSEELLRRIRDLEVQSRKVRPDKAKIFRAVERITVILCDHCLESK